MAIETSVWLSALIVCVILIALFYWVTERATKHARTEQTEYIKRALEYAEKIGLNVSYAKVPKSDKTDTTTIVIEGVYSTIRMRWYPSMGQFKAIVHRWKEDPTFYYSIQCEYYDVILMTIKNLMGTNDNYEK